MAPRQGDLTISLGKNQNRYGTLWCWQELRCSRGLPWTKTDIISRNL